MHEKKALSFDRVPTLSLPYQANRYQLYHAGGNLGNAVLTADPRGLLAFEVVCSGGLMAFLQLNRFGVPSPGLSLRTCPSGWWEICAISWMKKKSTRKESGRWSVWQWSSFDQKSLRPNELPASRWSEMASLLMLIHAVGRNKSRWHQLVPKG